MDRKTLEAFKVIAQLEPKTLKRLSTEQAATAQFAEIDDWNQAIAYAKRITEREIED